MSKVHLARSGFITKAALPSITRQRGTVSGPSNLLLFGAGKTTVANNTTFIDSSTNAFTVTRNGDTVHSGHNPFGTVSDGSAYFDGTGDNLGLASNKINLSTGDFTIEGWVYRTALSGSFGGIYDGIFSIQGYGTGWNDGGQGMGIGCGNIHTPAFPSGGKNFSSSVPLNQWTHIAVTRSSGTFRVFLNGVQVVTFTDTSAIGNGSVGFPVLGQFDNGRFYLTGYISNFRVVTGTVLYTANFTPPTAPLTAISGTSLLLLTNNYSIVNSTPTPLPVTIFDNTTISTAQYPTGMTSSIYFDGTGDYLTIPNGGQFQFGTGNFTVEWWQYQTGSKLYPRVFSVGGYPSASVAVSLESGSIYYWANGALTLRSYGTIINTWVHFAISRSSNVTKIFKNGVQLGPDATDNNNISNSSTALTIGTEATPSTDTYYNGYISNLRFVKGAALYTANFTPSSLPLSVNISAPNYVSNAIYGVNQLA